jgi:hypothetical protein
MNTLKLIFTELLGLFIDDGSFAFLIVGLVVVIGILARFFLGQPAIIGSLLMAGCIAILAESTLRAGRKS